MIFRQNLKLAYRKENAQFSKYLIFRKIIDLAMRLSQMGDSSRVN